VRQLVWFDRNGVRTGVAGNAAVQDRFDVDATGQLVAVERLGEDGTQLWLLDLVRGSITQRMWAALPSGLPCCHGMAGASRTSRGRRGAPRWWSGRRTAGPGGSCSTIAARASSTSEQWLVSAGGGEHPQWRGDGRDLLFIAPDGSITSSAITPGPKFDFAAPQVLFKTGVTDPAIQRFVATADGSRFLFNTMPEVTGPRRPRPYRRC
jgi:hypothetical protein